MSNHTCTDNFDLMAVILGTAPTCAACEQAADDFDTEMAAVNAAAAKQAACRRCGGTGRYKGHTKTDSRCWACHPEAAPFGRGVFADADI